MTELSINIGRRHISTAGKARIVEELYTSGLSTTKVARVNKVGLS